ncbi:MAG: LysR family transcriptional regulator, partial [Rhodoferax sp.]|nr:LysR family transcriptional regulator [Rhodoferax sp.]
RRLHLTQSAVSHALTRLRELVGDELFVRTGKGMVPTGRASAMAPTLRDSLRRIESTLGVEPFSPDRSTRKFVIAANDHLTAVVVGPLSRALRKTAPGVDLVVRPSTRLDLAEQIDLGRIDLAIGIFSQVPARLNARMLMSEGEAVLMRKGHPAARRKLTLEDIAKYPLLTVSVGGQEEGAVDGFILERGLARQSEMFDRHALEEALAGIGQVPRLRVTVPHSLALPALLRGSDMVSIVPTSLARALATGGDLVLRQPPYRTGTATTRAVWHRRVEHDAAHMWLREQVAGSVTPAKAGTPRAG